MLALLIGTVAIAGVLAGRLFLRRRAHGLVGLSAQPLSLSLGRKRPLVEALL